MEELLKYTRLLFQEQYLKHTSVHECIVDLVKESVYKCTCIPGVAANYILNVAEHCFYCFDGSCCIEWNGEEHRYIAQYRNKMGQLCFANFISETCEGMNANVVCVEREKNKLEKEQDVDFAYIKLWNNENVTSEYKVSFGNCRIENCLFAAGEKNSDDKELFRFFSYIVKEYRVIHDMKTYLDMMFRLYLFLFPEKGIAVIEEQFSNKTEDKEFLNYNGKLLEEYMRMASEIKVNNQERINQYFTLLSKFLLIDFRKVYSNCLSGNLVGDGQTLKGLIYQRLKDVDSNAVSKVPEVMKKVYKRTIDKK